MVEQFGLAMMRSSFVSVPVDLGHDELLVGIHPPGGGVVDDRDTRLGEPGRPLERGRSAGWRTKPGPAFPRWRRSWSVP